MNKNEKILLEALSKLSGKKGIYVYPSQFQNAYDYIASKALNTENISEKIRKTVLNLILEHNINFSKIKFVSGS